MIVRTPRPRDTVYIRTLPLVNGNYGGILQAYALQRVITDLGLRPVTDTSVPADWLKRTLRRPYYATVRRVTPTGVANVRLDRFVREHITTDRRIERAYSGAPPRFDDVLAFVTGSDQIWRAQWAHIPSGFLSFADGYPAPRLSYAASFGVDTTDEYSQADLEIARRMLPTFSAVSAREDSGVDLCSTIFGVPAQRHIDPTMLLPRDAYDALIATVARGSAPARGRLLHYVLTPSEEATQLVDAVAAKTGLSPHAAMPTLSPERPGRWWNAKQFTRPSIEMWLANIRESALVLTDSYHGTVFSILFNRPFLVFANPQRGQARIRTLLATFGLEDRLIDLAAASERPIPAEPAWQRIDDIRAQERARGLSYLAANLGTAP
ncbi:polysaccharide pyruvyl transferase family protein [Micropruina sp.]|uniref:polysaccharide pyruvyl transferase family protein n=1 Tax=Micropruina sp. TaxID=2737536 RepID=UPI0039E433BA